MSPLSSGTFNENAAAQHVVAGGSMGEYEVTMVCAACDTFLKTGEQNYKSSPASNEPDGTCAILLGWPEP